MLFLTIMQNISHRKAEDGRVYVVKTEKFITEAEIESIRNKQEKVKKHKKDKHTSKSQNHQS